MGKFNIDIDKLAESMLRVFIIGTITFAANYIRSNGVENQKLGTDLLEIKYEMKLINSVNNEIMLKLKTHDSILNSLERRRK